MPGTTFHFIVIFCRKNLKIEINFFIEKHVTQFQQSHPPPPPSAILIWHFRPLSKTFKLSLYIVRQKEIVAVPKMKFLEN